MHVCMCVYSRIAAQSGWARGLRIGLQRLPAYILQGGTNLSPQVSLDWPGSESSTVQSREDGRGGRGEEKESKVGGVEGWESTALTLACSLSPSSLHMNSNTDSHKGTLALHAQIMSHGNTADRRGDPVRGGHWGRFFASSYSCSTKGPGEAAGRQSHSPR